MLLKVRNPKLQFPYACPDIFKELKGSRPKVKVTKVWWKIPMEGQIKYNSDGASRKNPGNSSYSFCLRGDRGDLMHAQGSKIEDTINMLIQAYEMLQALCFSDTIQCNKVIFQTDFLAIMKFLTREWNHPWSILEIIEKIWILTVNK